MNWQKLARGICAFGRVAALAHRRFNPLASEMVKAYQQKLAAAVGSLRNDSRSIRQKLFLIDLIRALPVCLRYPRAWTDPADHAAKYQRSQRAFSKKLAMFWLVFGRAGRCWKRGQYAISVCQRS